MLSTLKKVGIILVISFPSHAAITIQQAAQVTQTASQMDQLCQQMYALGVNTTLAFQNSGYIIQGSTVTYPLSVQQQADIQANYAAIKSQMSALFGTLP